MPSYLWKADLPFFPLAARPMPCCESSEARTVPENPRGPTAAVSPTDSRRCVGGDKRTHSAAVETNARLLATCKGCWHRRPALIEGRPTALVGRYTGERETSRDLAERPPRASSPVPMTGLPSRKPHAASIARGPATVLEILVVQHGQLQLLFESGPWQERLLLFLFGKQ